MVKNRKWTLVVDDETWVRETISTIPETVRFERKLAQDARLKKQQRVTAATEIATLGTWEYDPVSSLISCDERCREILGLTEARAVSAEDVFKLVHREDRELVRKQVRESLISKGTGIYTTEYRNLGPDGTVNWVMVHAMLGEETAERLPRFIGTIVDITRQKQAEEATRNALDRLEHRVQELTAELGVPQETGTTSSSTVSADTPKAALPNTHVAHH
jgi:PAS domain S-box-containing protein